MTAAKLNIVINPVSHFCDLDCRYCFRKDEALPSETMSMEMVRSLLEQVFSLTEKGGEITFTFQGGEPTLAGIEFYQEFTAMAQELCPPGCHLFWAIQTHGLNLNDAWIDLFVRHDFEVSLSVDGYQALHDENRVDRTGAGTWKRSRAAFRMLREKDVVVNALCVITRQSSRRPEAVYQSLRKMGANNIIFRPCINGDSRKKPWSLTPPHLANFMCRVFDVWYEDWESGQYCFVNLFDDYIRLMQGHDCTDCTTSGRCGSTLVIDADGSIYPCEKYDSPAYRLGAVGEEGIAAALGSSQYRSFLQSGNQKPKECLDCSRRTLCNGGCRHDWVVDQKGMHNPYCDAYKRFFIYAYPGLTQIAKEAKEN